VIICCKMVLCRREKIENEIALKKAQEEHRCVKIASYVISMITHYGGVVWCGVVCRMRMASERKRYQDMYETKTISAETLNRIKRRSEMAQRFYHHHLLISYGWCPWLRYVNEIR
jgi:hypothetical protein